MDNVLNKPARLNTIFNTICQVQDNVKNAQLIANFALLPFSANSVLMALLFTLML